MDMNLTWQQISFIYQKLIFYTFATCLRTSVLTDPISELNFYTECLTYNFLSQSLCIVVKHGQMHIKWYVF